MQLSQVAYEAARIASERGHCKGIEQDEDGHVCLVGAINLALIAEYPEESLQYGTVPYTSPLRLLQSKILHAAGVVLKTMGVELRNVTYQEDWEPVPHAIRWNNLPEITGEDVVLVLKKAADLLENE